MTPDDPTPEGPAGRPNGETGAGRMGPMEVGRILLRSVPLLGPVKWHVVALLGVTTLAMLALVYPAFQLVDTFWTRILAGQAISEQQAALIFLDPGAALHWNDETRKTALRHLVVVSTLLGAIATLLFTGLYYYRVWILQLVNQNLRVQLVERLQQLSLRFHNDRAVGDNIYRVYQDSSMVTQLLDLLFLTPIQTISRLAFSLALVAMFKPSLALLLLVCWPVLAIILWWFSGRLRMGFRAARESNSALTALIQENLVGLRVIKAYRAEERQLARFEASSHQAFGHAYRARDRFAVYRMLSFWTVAMVGVAAAAWAALQTQAKVSIYAADLLAAWGFTAWNLGLFNIFKARAGDAAMSGMRLMDLWGRSQDIAIGLDRVFEMLDQEPEVADRPGAGPMPGLGTGITYSGISFSYGPQRKVLKAVNLEAAPGSITAVVGPTGSGKTTLMALLLRLYGPDGGRISIDGVDLRDIKLSELRANVAIVLQENVLFGTTIRENIRYAVPDASDAAVRRAAEVAGANGFIEALPAGYDTPLGERGAKLSTGQRQRLSIARAVLKDTPILVLDEPTASLDAQTEQLVMDNLAAWSKQREGGRVIFLITHRLSTIRRADRVIVLGEGRLVESGTHDELMGLAGGSYRRLFEAEAASVGAAGAPR